MLKHWNKIAIFAALMGSSTYAIPVCAQIHTGAAATAPVFKADIKGNLLELLPPPGHHFNEKAPSKLSLGASPLKANVRRERITAKLPKAKGLVRATVYVCDDANTYCLKQTKDIPLDSMTPEKAANLQKEVPDKGKNHKTPAIEKDTGFIVNDAKLAFAEAARLRRPLLIAFHGIWCPPCNHLDAMVFRSDEFKSRTASNWVRLKVDSDSDLAREWKKKYNITALPTVVFATPEGDEITRLLGFHPLDEIVKQADLAWKYRNEGLATLLQRARQNDADAQFRASQILLDLNRPAQALEWLAPMKAMFQAAEDPRIETVFRAELAVAQQNGDASQAKRILRDWTAAFPKSVQTLENLQKLSEMEEDAGNSKARDTALRQAIGLVDGLLGKSEAQLAEHLKGTEYGPANLLETAAGLYEETGATEKARATYLKAADAFLAKAKSEKTDFARGPSLERAYCLAKAGKSQEAEAIYREGARRFPQEYTYHRALADFLLRELKQPEKAVESIDRALQYAYGPQRLKAILVKAKALEAMGKFQLAAHAIQIELQTRSSEAADMAGTLKLRKSLEARRDELLKKL